MSPTRDPAALSATERRTHLAGIETRELLLDGDGPPLLLLHGYADSADTWRPLMRRLAAVGRAAAAVDLTGFGTAQPLEPEGPMLPQWDRLVHAAIEELAERHGDEVIVVGNSLGGALSLRAAERAELPIAGIVPIAPAGLHMAQWFGVIESERLIRLLQRSPLPVPERIVPGVRRACLESDRGDRERWKRRERVVGVDPGNTLPSRPVLARGGYPVERSHRA